MSEDEKAVKSMLLPLAERMVSKYVKDKKVDAEAGKNSSIKLILTACYVNYFLNLVLLNMLSSFHQPACDMCCCHCLRKCLPEILATA